MSDLKKFSYKKESGEVSERVLFVLNKPSDSYFGIDLTQFDEVEQKFYQTELERISEMMKEEIAELGLDSCYRRFKEDRIVQEKS